MQKPVARNHSIWVFLILCLLTVMVYAPGLTGDYMFDDRSNILDNKRLDIDTLSFDSLQAASLSSSSGLLRRPVSMLSFTLNRHFFGIAPYSYKVINLAIHLLTGLGLFLLCRMLVNRYRQKHSRGLSQQALNWLPVIVTGLWLVHPLNLSSVLYIVQRMTSLSALFTVVGLILYVAGRNRMLAGRRGLPHILTGLIVFGGLSILSKENGVLLPLYMFVIELALYRFRNPAGQLDKVLAGFFTLVLFIPGLGVLYLLIFNPDSFFAYHGREFTLIERALTESRVLVFYLKMILMPTTTELGLFHDDITLSRGLLDPSSTLYSLIALAGMLLGALLLLRKQPLISLGILWFFAGHVLESTIFPLEIAHEHRNYIADFGIILAIATAITLLPLKTLGPVIRTLTPALFLLLFSYTSWLRAGQWSDNVNFAVYEAMHHPKSLRAVYGAGRIHARLALEGHTDSIDKAFNHLEQADKLGTSSIMPRIVIIKLSYLLGRPVEDAWFDDIFEKLSRYPITPSTLNSIYELANCIGKSCTVSPDIMEEMFRLTLENPVLEFNRHLHAEAVTIYGYYTINKRGNFDKGRELFHEAVELDPEVAQRRINLINLLIVMQRTEEAEQQLALFRKAETHSGNEADFKHLTNEINTKRKELSSSSDSTNQETLPR